MSVTNTTNTLSPASKSGVPTPTPNTDEPKWPEGDKTGSLLWSKTDKKSGNQKKTVGPDGQSGLDQKIGGPGETGSKDDGSPFPSPKYQGSNTFLSPDPNAPSPSPARPPSSNPNALKAFLSGLSGSADATAAANTLTQGLDSSAAAQIEQPLQIAGDLQQNWNAWGLHEGVDFNNPPAGLPQQAYDDFKAIASSPTLRAALAGGTSKALVTLASVTNFATKADSDLKAGAASYAAYLSANPNASASAKDLARQAAIVDANLTLLSTNGDGRPSIGDFNRADSDPGLGAVIRNAADLFGQSGLFQELDSAGQNPLTTVNDGVLNQDNITTWTKTAPVSDDDFQSLMTQASVATAVGGSSTSGLTGDVLANPDRYSGGQKAAVLMQLESTLDRYQLGLKNGQTVYPDDNAAMRHLTDAIEKLSEDPDVASVLSSNSLSGLEQMIGQNPLLNADVTASFESYKSTAQLQSDLDKGTPVRQALETFIKQYNFYNNALTLSSGLHDPAINSAADIISNNPNLYNKILAFSNNSIVNSQELSDSIANGTDPITAVQQFVGDVSLVSSLLPPATRPALMVGVQSSFMDVMADQILSSGTTSDLNRVFADAGGNLDQAKLTQELQQAMQQSPSLFTDGNGEPISPDKIVNAFKNVWDAMRSGAKITDALGKLGYPELGNKTIQGYYGQGVLHAVSALFGAGILSAKGATGNDPVSIESTALSTFGTAIEAGSKYFSKAGGSGLTSDQLKTLESGGKIVGGLGGALGGALGIMSGIKDLSGGDTAGATINLSGGITGLLAAGGSITDGAVGLAAAAGVEGLADISAGIAAAAGGLSIFGGVIGIAGLAALSIISDVKEQNIADKFSDRVGSVFTQYGIATS